MQQPIGVMFHPKWLLWPYLLWPFLESSLCFSMYRPELWQSGVHGCLVHINPSFWFYSLLFSIFWISFTARIDGAGLDVRHLETGHASGYITAHVNFTRKGWESNAVIAAREMSEHLKTGHISGFIIAQVNFTRKGCQIQSQWLGKWLDKIIPTEIIKIQANKSSKECYLLGQNTTCTFWG